MKQAVHFGAGNIGRGFIGERLSLSGYRVVFVDVAKELIDKLNEIDAYTVWEIGLETAVNAVRVENFSAINLLSDRDRVVEKIAQSSLVTTAVGVGILPKIAPVVAKGLSRSSKTPAVIACENAINATDQLKEEVFRYLPDASSRAVFANAAVDRVAPDQGILINYGFGPEDVGVEGYFEWLIDKTPFKGCLPPIVGVGWVEDLTPYIERKLFTVNTGHATLAYLGAAKGYTQIERAVKDPQILAEVREVLGETKAALYQRHGWHEGEQDQYIDKTLERFGSIPDQVSRAARSPLRKISRNERFIGPASQLSEAGIKPKALLGAIGALLRFYNESDPESVRLLDHLKTVRQKAEAIPAITAELTGLQPNHPLFWPVAEEIESAAGLV